MPRRRPPLPRRPPSASAPRAEPESLTRKPTHGIRSDPSRQRPPPGGGSRLQGRHHQTRRDRQARRNGQDDLGHAGRPGLGGDAETGLPGRRNRIEEICMVPRVTPAGPGLHPLAARRESGFARRSGPSGSNRHPPERSLRVAQPLAPMGCGAETMPTDWPCAVSRYPHNAIRRWMAGCPAPIVAERTPKLF